MSLPPKYQRLREAAEKAFNLPEGHWLVNKYWLEANPKAILDLLAAYEEALERMSELEKHKRRFADMFPLFVEARDALPAIPLAEAKLRGLDLTLADRMDAVGVLEEWEATDAKRQEQSR